MRLGGPLFEKWDSPEAWCEAVRRQGYRAAFCPVPVGTDGESVRAYARAAERAGIVIAEVGAWSNPLSPDEAKRREGEEKCRQGLSLADEIGARCCVNITGSRGTRWDGPHPDNLTDGTFDMIVEGVRKIIDDVGPVRSFYTLETMPWMYPDSTDSYLRLVQAIDRRAFAVHFDPVNLVCSPQRYYSNGALIREFIDKLGSYIRSCHAKDILLQEKLTVHLDEVRPGLGGLDYPTYLRGLSALDPDTPLMLEHLSGAEEYRLAADHVATVVQKEGLSL